MKHLNLPTLAIALIVPALSGYAKIPAADREQQLAPSAFGEDSLFTADAVLTLMEKVADWQLDTWDEKGYKYRKWDWTNAAGYTGLFALGGISRNERYFGRLVDIGNEIHWETGPRRFLADDYCIGQTYAQLYQKYGQEKMIAPFRRQADSIVAAPFSEPLTWGNGIKSREWAWCDALFMAPPSLAYLSTATGNQQYLDKACKLWWKTTDFLFDEKENLYFRDSRFFSKREKNGEKVFWSRGNGWVLAGLVRMLDNMPPDYPERKKFTALYKKMMKRILSLQQPDGSWHTSLLDPESYPDVETSGTGFYCYAILWGLNNGILRESRYWPAARSAWTALAGSVRPDGMLGNVQSIAGAPTAIAGNNSEIYAVGAFLLAGSALHEYLETKD